MKVDAALLTPNLSDVPRRVRELEDAGFDGCFSFEGPQEPFLSLALAAEHSQKLEVATGLTIAFARTPMIVAHLADSLQRFSRGRFVLGLGSQIRPHIEARYSMPWSKPIPRMKEFVRALRAIFACWSGEGPLDFRGDFYTHTLMPPVFNPGKNPYGMPPVYLGGVGPKMTEAAGEVADGMVVHPFHSEKSLHQVTLPAVRKGLKKSQRSLSEFTLAVQVLVVTGPNEQVFTQAKHVTKQQIAFYASTPAYRGVLEAEGWHDMQPTLRQLTKEGRWTEMGSLITDEVLERFALVGTPAQVARVASTRYGAVANRLGFASPYAIDPGCANEIIAGLTTP